jgi:hypothetical protein
MKTKRFDCIEMKRRGAARIHERLQGMTFEQEVAYWTERSEAFRRDQEAVCAPGTKTPRRMSAPRERV